MSYITPGGGKMIWVEVIDTIEDVGRPGQYNWENQYCMSLTQRYRRNFLPYSQQDQNILECI